MKIKYYLYKIKFYNGILFYFINHNSCNYFFMWIFAVKKRTYVNMLIHETTSFNKYNLFTCMYLYLLFFRYFFLIWTDDKSVHQIEIFYKMRDTYFSIKEKKFYQKRKKKYCSKKNEK